jgi:hypothetical protein
MAKAASILFALDLLAGSAPAAELRIGAATVDLTPDTPVALDGQFHVRISKGVDNPVQATAVALEGREGDRGGEQAIFLSADLVNFTPLICKSLRERLKASLPDFDANKLVMTATHTHTAPVVNEGWYKIPEQGVMPTAEYREFLLGRLEEVVLRAWKARQPGGVSWGLGYAMVGHPRRSVYADGSAKMYGSTAIPEFRGLEGASDPGLETLFFWNARKELLAAGINVACPAQEVENRSTLNADFWHDVREHLRTHLAKDLAVLGWPAACGDLSPRRMVRKAAEDRMLKLRGLSHTQEIGRRIGREVADLCALVSQDLRTEVPFAHRVEQLTLPVRKVTEEEVSKAEKELEARKEKGEKGLRLGWLQATIQRFRDQGAHPTFTVNVHVLRIGDVAIVTSPFELFSDYGMQIKGRSRAEQTFVLELTDGSEQYLPTARAVAGGGYSAVVQSSRGGPEAGQMLVDRTVEMIHALWPDPPKAPQTESPAITPPKT